MLRSFWRNSIIRPWKFPLFHPGLLYVPSRSKLIIDCIRYFLGTADAFANVCDHTVCIACVRIGKRLAIYYLRLSTQQLCLINVRSSDRKFRNLSYRINGRERRSILGRILLHGIHHYGSLDQVAILFPRISREARKFSLPWRSSPKSSGADECRSVARCRRYTEAIVRRKVLRVLFR